MSLTFLFCSSLFIHKTNHNSLLTDRHTSHHATASVLLFFSLPKTHTIKSLGSSNLRQMRTTVNAATPLMNDSPYPIVVVMWVKLSKTQQLPKQRNPRGLLGANATIYCTHLGIRRILSSGVCVHTAVEVRMCLKIHQVHRRTRPPFSHRHDSIWKHNRYFSIILIRESPSLAFPGGGLWILWVDGSTHKQPATKF